MTVATYTTPHRPAKLHDELAARFPTYARSVPSYDDASIRRIIVSDGTTVTFTVADNITVAQLDELMAAHDPTTPGPTEQAVANERTIDERLAAQLPVLRDAITAITATPPTLFAGLSNQERVFLRRLARNQSDLIRLVLRLLEATD